MCAIAIAHSPTAADSLRLPEPQTRGYIVSLLRSLSRNWLELETRRVAEAGFNLLVFPAFNNGWTLFPSEAAREAGMKRINPLFRKWNPLATACDLSLRAGLRVWAYVRPYNFHPRYSIAEHTLLRKFPHWRQQAHPAFQNARTRREEHWRPCPVNPGYRRYLAGILCEMVSAYPIEGVVFNFDNLGLFGGPLAESPFCFCAACRQNYYEAYQADLIGDAVGPRLGRVRAWQLAQIQEHFIYLRHRMIRSRRTLRVVCRAKPTWRESPDYTLPPGRGAVLMDWPALLASGAIEELAIDHDGEPLNAQIGARLAADYAYLGDRVLFLPIVAVGALEELAFPLAAIRRHPIPGLLAEFQTSFTEEDARQIRETCFPEPAPLPEADPVRTAAFLLSRIRLLHEDHPVIYDLLYDLLRLLARQLPTPTDFTILTVIEQNIHGLEQYIRRGRLGKARIPEHTLRDLGLARRFVRMACMDVRS